MATLPVVPTLAVGDLLTAARWQTVVDLMTFLENPPRATVWRSTSQSIPNATSTLVTWDTEDEDTDSMHSTVTNTSRLVCNTAGALLVTASARFASGAGNFLIDVRKNAAGSATGGTSVLANSFPLASVTGNGGTVTKRIPGFIVTDYVEMFVLQNTGGALNLLGGAVNLAMFQAAWVGAS